MYRYRAKMQLKALILATTSCVCLGAVTGPIDSTDGIRIVPKGASVLHKQSTQPVHLQTKTTSTTGTNPPEPVLQTKTTSTTGNPPEPVKFNAEARLNITEPPPNSYVMGETLSVKIDIQPYNRDNFLSAYEDSADAKICVSLDSSPFLCWPALTGRILYSQVTEGKHTLEAMLYNDGEIKTKSRTVTSFIMVHDPDIVASGEDEQETEQDLDEDPSAGGEQIQVEFPIVQISSPAANVTYPGTSVQARFVMEPSNPDLFKHYFANAHVCVNIDSAPAYGCFSVFGDVRFAPPLVLGLENGRHTIEAALSHPETGDVLYDSVSPTSTFFTAGELNEAATVAVEVTVSGSKYIVPIIEGSNLHAQTDAFCEDVGMAKNPSCTERILHKLSSAWEKKDGSGIM